MMGPGAISSMHGVSLANSLGGMLVMAIFAGLPFYGIPFAIVCGLWTLSHRKEADWDALRAALRSSCVTVPLSVAVCVLTTVLASYSGSPLLQGVALACTYVVAGAICSSFVFKWGLHGAPSPAASDEEASQAARSRSLALYSLAVWAIPLLFNLALAAQRA